MKEPSTRLALSALALTIGAKLTESDLEFWGAVAGLVAVLLMPEGGRR